MKEEYSDYINKIIHEKSEIEDLIEERKKKIEKFEKRNIRKKRLSFFAGLFLSLSISLSIFFYFKENIIFDKTKSTTFLLALLSITIALGFYLMKYLQPNMIKKNSHNNFEKNYLEELSEIKYNIELLKKKSGKTEDTEININDIVEKAIENKFNDNYIEEKINSNFKEEAQKNKKNNSLLYYIESKSNRLDEEILRLRKSANLNLVIGTLSTFLAIFCLVYEVFYNGINFKNNVEILSHYIPRISLVIFIEFFAFFFLKLYKSNLYEIKYFNNEKTNIDFKIFSLRTAIQLDDKEMIKLCISNFIETERNFIIKKDETTIDFERHKFDNVNNSELKDLLLGVLKTNK
ncbi:hypothetical protein FIA58_001300 [Flavobacterium jejuense]|uniref:Uncharacterized protein n=1 Tax=Flavobacterium jejuense TaxID=1544455 RepID=A0ABX0IMV5_9FLAO|nr:hypothetical protein [Flavobacterium jejuense]NHN24297.1 hypothetical protein [Flavobacterium jejuense]